MPELLQDWGLCSVLYVPSSCPAPLNTWDTTQKMTVLSSIGQKKLRIRMDFLRELQSHPHFMVVGILVFSFVEGELSICRTDGSHPLQGSNEVSSSS